MLSQILRLSLACLAVCCFSAQSSAQDVSCKREVVATGGGALTEAGAKKKAIDAWRKQVVADLGIFYGDFEQANDGKGGGIERCARSLLGLTVCQARGRPCQGPSGATEIKCDRGDSKNCDPTVKWVQSRLKAKGYDVSVDGAAGPNTEKAISAYRKKTGVGEGGEIDEKLVGSLKG
jgi:hypothetical protein